MEANDFQKEYIIQYKIFGGDFVLFVPFSPVECNYLCREILSELHLTSYSQSGATYDLLWITAESELKYMMIAWYIEKLAIGSFVTVDILQRGVNVFKSLAN